jgi:ABC-type branched-subunit amino acid transport system substrate-binding protein
MKLRRWCAAALVAMVLGAACGSDSGEGDGTTTTTTDTSGSSNDSTATTGGGGSVSVADLANLDGAELRAAQAEIVAAIAENPYTCQEAPEGAELGDSDTGVTADSIKVGFIEADLEAILPLGLAVDLGDEGGNFSAIADLINECGGINGRTLDVTVYEYQVADVNEGRQRCTEATEQDGNFVVVTRVFIQDLPLCITETNETPLIINFSGTDEFYERSEGRMVTINASEARIAEAAVKVYVDEGIITPDSVVGLVWGDVVDQNILVENTLRDALGSAAAKVVETPVEQPTPLACSGHTTAVQKMVSEDVDVVLGLFGGPCYGDFVIEAANQGFFPQYLTIDKGGMTSDVGTSKMPQAGDAFEGAYGVTMTPGELGVKDQAEVPYAWDRRCNEILAERTGNELEFPTDPYAAANGPCTSAYLLIEALKLAGTDLTHESFLDAIGKVEVVPASGDIAFTGYGKGLPEGPDDVAYLIQWSLDCECWATVSDPKRLG